MGWLKRMISKFKTNSQPNEAKSPGAIKKIAILVGHGAGDSGAIGWNKVEEHEYNKKVASIVSEMNLGKEIKVYFKAKGGWVSTYTEIAKFNPDLSIELHLNAATGNAVGCEVLVLKGHNDSASIGMSFANMFTQKFSRKIRGDKGIKWISSGDRGYGNLVGVSMAATWSVLVEPFFIDTKSEWIEPEEYAKFLAEWLRGI